MITTTQPVLYCTREQQSTEINNPIVLYNSTTPHNYHRGKVFSFCSYTLRNRKGPKKLGLPRETLKQYFNLPQKEAAKKLGVSLSTLKRRFYDEFDFKWPYTRSKTNEDHGETLIDLQIYNQDKMNTISETSLHPLQVDKNNNESKVFSLGPIYDFSTAIKINQIDNTKYINSPVYMMRSEDVYSKGHTFEYRTIKTTKLPPISTIMELVK